MTHPSVEVEPLFGSAATVLNPCSHNPDHSNGAYNVFLNRLERQCGQTGEYCRGEEAGGAVRRWKEQGQKLVGYRYYTFLFIF